MNNGDLKEYEAREIEEFADYVKAFKEGRFVGYPRLSRFSKLGRPIGVRTEDGPIWAQIPFFGSLLVSVYPVEERYFSKVHGFEARDLRRLIDLSKDTGRVQFVLESYPVQYVGLDYLDELFHELRPPVRLSLGFEGLVPPREEQKYLEEFDTMSEGSYHAFMDLVFRDVGFGGGEDEKVMARYLQGRLTYSWLRSFGFDKAAEHVLDNLKTNPPEAFVTLNLYNRFVFKPMVDQLKPIYCYSLGELSRFSRISGGNQLTVGGSRLPCEVGAFLLKELTLVPESFASCMSLIDRYKQNDLQSLLDALSSAVKDEKPDLVQVKSAEVSDILENVWREGSRLSSQAKGISYGISTVLSAGGSFAGTLLSGATGGVTGLLAGLGFQLVDKSIDIGSGRLSERLARFVSKSYVGTVFDFKKKYNLI